MRNKVEENHVVDAHLCYGCGVCVGMCPKKAISLAKEKNDISHAVIDDEKCNNCEICRKICPVNGWQGIHYLENHSNQEIDHCLKPYVELGFGYAQDPVIRSRGTSGGMVTAILVNLLQSSEIDGAIVATARKLDGEYSLITNKRDLIKHQKSKYFCIPMDIQMEDIKQCGNLAFVGLPCHIEAINNACEIYPVLKKRIKYKICLLCASNLKKDFYSFVIGRDRISLNQVKELKFRPGFWWKLDYFSVGTQDKVKVYSLRKGIVSAVVPGRLFSRDACLLCPDFTGKGADVSFGDAWHPRYQGNREGYNFYITRTETGKELFKRLKHNNQVICQRGSVEDFCNSSLINPLIFKHEGVRERASFLRSLGRRTPKNIPITKGSWSMVRAGSLYAGRRFFSVLYENNILDSMPERIIMAYAYAISFLSRRERLKLLSGFVLRKKREQ